MTAETFFGAVFTYGPAIIGAASAAAATLPQGKEGSTWYTVRKVIDFAAFNFGNAANAKK
ncbi:MAG: hypothetical protein PHS14_21115 [Elusimicrobia bacterium]|nr:hypothetical protein [Elusimicrobiota bacterium]